jgi:hypothetical protein
MVRKKNVSMIIIKVIFIILGAYGGLITANLIEKLTAAPSGAASS